MQYFLKQREVEAQQYLGNIKAITLVELKQPEGPGTRPCFSSRGLLHFISYSDLIVLDPNTDELGIVSDKEFKLFYIEENQSDPSSKEVEHLQKYLKRYEAFVIEIERHLNNRTSNTYQSVQSAIRDVKFDLRDMEWGN